MITDTGAELQGRSHLLDYKSKVEFLKARRKSTLPHPKLSSLINLAG